MVNVSGFGKGRYSHMHNCATFPPVVYTYMVFLYSCYQSGHQSIKDGSSLSFKFLHMHKLKGEITDDFDDAKRKECVVQVFDLAVTCL